MNIINISHLDVATMDYVSNKPNTLVYRVVNKLEIRPPATKKDIPWFNDCGSLEIALNFSFDKTPSIILMIAAFTIAKLFGGQIKWPNDVVLQGKKVAGMMIKFDGKQLIFGSGINLNRKQFNKEIQHKATSYINVYNKEWEPKDFVEQFLNNFLTNLNKVKIKDLEQIQIFKNKVFTIDGKEYKFLSLNSDGSANWMINGKEETFKSFSLSFTNHYELFKY